MEISKKDLLLLTHISYGQLYRWKREGLIPESWFFKRSSYTGQETFFPRVEILERIQFIQENKDRYSLEDLAKMLSPEKSNRKFYPVDLEKINIINSEVSSLYYDFINRENFTYTEVIVLCAISEVVEKYQLVIKDQMDWIISLAHLFVNEHNIDQTIMICELGNQLFTILVNENNEAKIDEQIKVIAKINLSEVAKEFRFKYQDVFHLAFN